MSVLIDRLRAAGADMDGAMERMLEDEELFASCFTMFMDDPAFGALKTAMGEQDYYAAFEAAHTLKGVSANLGLTALFNAASALAEPLRRGDPGDADIKALYAALLAEWDNLKALLD